MSSAAGSNAVPDGVEIVVLEGRAVDEMVGKIRAAAAAATAAEAVDAWRAEHGDEHYRDQGHDHAVVGETLMYLHDAPDGMLVPHAVYPDGSEKVYTDLEHAGERLLMHVVIGTDGSEDAIEAASRALTILAADSLTVLTVSETPAVATAGFESGFAGGVASPEQVDDAWSTVEVEANAALDATIGAITAANPALPIERRIEIGDPGQTLCRLAGELSADVVVVGSRGRGAFKRAVLGSVSGHVVHNAPCPVLVIRAED